MGFSRKENSTRVFFPELESRKLLRISIPDHPTYDRGSQLPSHFCPSLPLASMAGAPPRVHMALCVGCNVVPRESVTMVTDTGPTLGTSRTWTWCACIALVEGWALYNWLWTPWA